MKLLFTDLSPYARKVRVTIAEERLAYRIKMVSVNLYEIPAALNATNPLCKVPILVTDSDAAPYDIAVTGENLDSEATDTHLIPAGAARFEILRRRALAKGIIATAFNVLSESTRRDEGERSPKWIKHFQ